MFAVRGYDCVSAVAEVLLKEVCAFQCLLSQVSAFAVQKRVDMGWPSAGHYMIRAGSSGDHCLGERMVSLLLPRIEAPSPPHLCATDMTCMRLSGDVLLVLAQVLLAHPLLPLGVCKRPVGLGANALLASCLYCCASQQPCLHAIPHMTVHRLHGSSGLRQLAKQEIIAIAAGSALCLMSEREKADVPTTNPSGGFKPALRRGPPAP